MKYEIDNLLLIRQEEYLDIYQGYSRTGKRLFYLVPNDRYRAELPQWDYRKLSTEEARTWLLGDEDLGYRGDPFQELEENGYIVVEE